jgi:hypothetical protein
LQNIGKEAQVDIFFIILTFRSLKLINESNGNYTKYIIMPTNLAEAASVIKNLPVNEVYILDQNKPRFKIVSCDIPKPS